LGEVKKDVRWILIISLVLILASPFIAVYALVGLPWDYATPSIWFTHFRNISTLFFIFTIITSTLYIADFWKAEPLYEATIVFFIISMSMFFISSMQWIFLLLGLG